MITLIINQKPVKVPTKWEELTYSQWVKLLEVKDSTFDLLSIFSEISHEELRKMTIIGVDEFINAVSFLQKPAEMPGSVNKCGPYKIPNNVKNQFNIQYESLGQFEDMRAVFKTIDDSAISLAKHYGKFVAIYLQKIRDKEYDYLKVQSMEDELQKFSGMEVITLGSFFFIRLTNLLSGTPKTSHPTFQKSKNSKPVSRSSKRSSGRMRR